MHHNEGSLRSLIAKWLFPHPAASVTFKRARMPGTHARYIKFGAQCGEERVAMYFFQHGDGEWYVFPEMQRAAMDAYHLAA